MLKTKRLYLDYDEVNCRSITKEVELDIPVLKIPELPPCPMHPDGPPEGKSAGCQVCWSRFWIMYEHERELIHINFAIESYLATVETRKEQMLRKAKA